MHALFADGSISVYLSPYVSSCLQVSLLPCLSLPLFLPPSLCAVCLSLHVFQALISLYTYTFGPASLTHTQRKTAAELGPTGANKRQSNSSLFGAKMLRYGSNSRPKAQHAGAPADRESQSREAPMDTSSHRAPCLVRAVTGRRTGHGRKGKKRKLSEGHISLYRVFETVVDTPYVRDKRGPPTTLTPELAPKKSISNPNHNRIAIKHHY